MPGPGYLVPAPQDQTGIHESQSFSTKPEGDHRDTLPAGLEEFKTLILEDQVDTRGTFDHSTNALPVTTSSTLPQEASVNEFSTCDPTKRAFSILDFPNEILIRISELVKDCNRKGSVPRSLDGYDPDIFSLRQACRRFYEVSSHLLFEHLRVDLTSSSLARLERISKHELFSKGVRGIEVWLERCHEEIVEEQKWFISDLRRAITPFVYMVASRRRKEPHVMDALRTGITFVWTCDNLLKSYEGLRTNQQPIHPDTRSFLDESRVQEYEKRIIKFHEEYKARFAEQEGVREPAYFVSATAAAVARMPRATTLQFFDRASRGADEEDADGMIRALKDSESYPKLVMRSLAENGEGDRTAQLKNPLAEIFYALPVSIVGAGARLLALKTYLGPRHTTSAQHFEPCDHDQVDLANWTRTLEEFDGGPSYPYKGWVLHGPRGVDETSFFPSPGYILGSFSTENIKSLTLTLNASYYAEKHAVDRARPEIWNPSLILCRLSWPRLKKLYLDDVLISLEEFRSFLKGLNSPLDKLTLISLRLVEGYWTELLDLLNDNRPKLVNLGGPTLELAKRENLIWRQVEWVFENHPSRAELYVMGQLKLNPMLAVHDVTSWEI